jgi:hypothetical protein
LNRQAERYAKEGVEISLSTLADQVGACTAALQPIHDLIRTHVLGAERLHADDTTVPLMARGGTQTARLWTYLRDDRPFAGGAPPAALYYFSTDRRMEHPTRHLAGWSGILQADAYGGYNGVYDAARKPAPVFSALCWSHARRKFFELADIKATARKGRPIAEDISPIALEAVKRIDAIFDVEREITGLTAAARLDARQRLVRTMVDDLHDWMRAERARMSKHNPVAKAINYMFEQEGRWDAFTRFLNDGRTRLFGRGDPVLPVDQGAVQAAAQADRRDGRQPAAPGRAGLARSGLLDALPQTEDPEGADPVSPCRRAAESARGQHRHRVPR